MATKKGFTLSELMLAILVLGILAALLLPTILKAMPDKNALMFKKIYSTLENAMNNTINDETNYPSDVTSATSDPNIRISQGFYNTSITGTNVPSGVNKFCYVLSQNIGALGAAATNCATSGSNTYTFNTQDGASWILKVDTFPLDTDSFTTKVIMDVNGTSNPNCGTGANITSSCPSGTTADKYEVGVRYDGKMKLEE